MRLSGTDLAPVLAIIAGGAVGVATSASLVLSSHFEDVPLANWTIPVPDGQRIVYWSSDGRLEYRAKEDFTRGTRLEAPVVWSRVYVGGGAVGTPMWSPDGSRIMFTRDGSLEIWVVNADGGTPTRLTVNDLEPSGR